jgi:hypothetical protein
MKINQSSSIFSHSNSRSIDLSIINNQEEDQDTHSLSLIIIALDLEFLALFLKGAGSRFGQAGWVDPIFDPQSSG